MAAKREAAAMHNTFTPHALQAMPEATRVLRGRVVPKQEHAKKTRRAAKRPKIDFGQIVSVLGDASFFKLPREIRDEIYQLVWYGVRIWQRYKRRRYIVSYGDPVDLNSEDDADMKTQWLLTSKQMLLEGLAEFHRHSVWVFESWGKIARDDYVFPLIVPALVHEQHLYVNGTGMARSHNCGLSHFRDVPYLWEGSPDYPYIIMPKPSTIGLINRMTDSCHSHDNVRKIKIVLQIHDKRLRFPRRDRDTEWRLYHLPGIMFDFSKLDLLAVHRGLEIFEVEIQVFKEEIIQSCANLDVAMANLMTELDIVGKALIPDGRCVQTGFEGGSWPLVSGVRCFTFVVSKA